MTRTILASMILCLALVPTAIADEGLEPTPAAPAENPEPAATQTPATEPPVDCSTLVESPALPPAPMFAAAGGAALSTCTADCWNGSSVTCTGSSCSATDSSCPTQRGYCWGTDTGYKYCPVCCSATLPCWKLDGRSCSPNGSHQQCLDGSHCFSCVCWNGIWACP